MNMLIIFKRPAKMTRHYLAMFKNLCRLAIYNPSDIDVIRSHRFSKHANMIMLAISRAIHAIFSISMSFKVFKANNALNYNSFIERICFTFHCFPITLTGAILWIFGAWMGNKIISAIFTYKCSWFSHKMLLTHFFSDVNKRITIL